jgi:hypothetical protein
MYLRTWSTLDGDIFSSQLSDASLADADSDFFLIFISSAD